ncbi:MAG: DUF938 domain-containing protein [Pseudomonadota bacterium]
MQTNDERGKGYPKSADGRPVALEARMAGQDGRRSSPSIARNRDVVRDAFLTSATRSGHVLEIASGTGEHGSHIADAAPDLHWSYSDLDADSRDSQAAWAAAAVHNRLHGPFIIDASETVWPAVEGQAFNAIFCANMVHIAPFAATKGLLAGASRHLAAEGKLFLYGPFARDGVIAPSNQAFSQSLKQRNPDWGVRDLDRDLVPLAETVGLRLANVIDMPANNLSVIFETVGPSA